MKMLMQLYVWITYVSEQNADKSTFSMDLLNAIIGTSTNAQIQAVYSKQLQMTINSCDARNITEICYVLKTWSLKMQDGKCRPYDMKMRGTKCQEWKMPEMKMKFQS